MPKKRKPRLYALTPTTVRSHAKEFVDYDYVDKLSDDERAWLSQFSREYYQSVFPQEGAMHDKDERKKVYARDNAARRDMWNNNWRVPVDATEYMPDEDEE